MADLGIPALLGALGVIGAGVWKKFFSTGAKRDKIRKYENEMSKLIELPASDKRRSRIKFLQSTLAKLHSELGNQAD